MILTIETTIKTRKWFIDNDQRCIDEALNGSVKVNDIDAYVAWCRKRSADTQAGLNDHTVTFIQRGIYIQSGEMIGILL